MKVVSLFISIVPFTFYEVKIAAVTIAGPGNYSQPGSVYTQPAGKHIYTIFYYCIFLFKMEIHVRPDALVILKVIRSNKMSVKITGDCYFENFVVNNNFFLAGYVLLARSNICFST